MHPSLQRISELLHLAFASVLGVLTRIGLSILFGPDVANVTSSTGALFSDLPANALGAFLMGMVVSYKTELIKLHPNVLLAIGTGYLGCVTTFASWNFQAIKMFAEGIWVSAFVALFLGTEVALASFVLGTHIKQAQESLFTGEKASLNPKDITSVADADPKNEQLDEELDEILNMEMGDYSDQQSPSQSKKADFPPSKVQQETSENILSSEITAVTASILWAVIYFPFVVAFVIDSNQTRRSYWFSCIVSPAGAILRWLLGKLNPKYPTFPIGTFLANVLATLGNAIINAIDIATNDVGQIYVTGIGLGFFGDLSTVSTWVSEIHGMKSTKNQYVYVLASIVVSQVLGLIVYGTAYWTR